MYPRLIAIDGPTASGKSAAGFRLATDLHYLFFDTGILFRIVCWQALRHSRTPSGETLFVQTAREMALELRPPTPAEIQAGHTTTVLVNGQDITWQLRHSRVDRLLPSVSAMAGVRQELTARMRQIGQASLDDSAAGRGVVVIGRDIGTVVFPDAACKLFLDAEPAVRAQRRHRELVAHGADISLAEVLADLQARDRMDSTRALAPAQAAADAMILDTTHWTLDETVAQVHACLEAHYA